MDAPAELLAERVAIAWRSGFIIKPLDHEREWGPFRRPTNLERQPSAGGEMLDKHRRPAFELRK